MFRVRSDRNIILSLWSSFSVRQVQRNGLAREEDLRLSDQVVRGVRDRRVATGTVRISLRPKLGGDQRYGGVHDTAGRTQTVSDPPFHGPAKRDDESCVRW